MTYPWLAMAGHWLVWVGQVGRNLPMAKHDQGLSAARVQVDQVASLHKIRRDVKLRVLFICPARSRPLATKTFRWYPPRA